MARPLLRLSLRGTMNEATNPSALSRRWPLVALALLGAADATYLALYQLGILTHVWEPLFGRGSAVILSSGSRFLPVPDAALGALAYFAEAVCLTIGGPARWRTLPYVVFACAALAGAFAVASVALIVLQIAYFHTGCTLCLLSAAISFAITALAKDELCASWRYLRHAGDRGQSAMHVFWGLGNHARQGGGL